MKPLQPIEFEWQADRFACTVRDPSGDAAPRRLAWFGLALAVGGGAVVLVAPTSIFLLILVVLVGPAFVVGGLYAAARAAVLGRATGHRVVVDPLLLSVRPLGASGEDVIVPLEQVESVQAQVHPFELLRVVCADGRIVEVPAGAHRAEDLVVLRGHVQHAVAQRKRYLEDRAVEDPDARQRLDALVEAVPPVS